MTAPRTASQPHRKDTDVRHTSRGGGGLHRLHDLRVPGLTRTAWLLTGNGDAAQGSSNRLVKTYVAWPRVRDGQALAYARAVLVNHHREQWRKFGREAAVDETPEPAVLAERRSPTATSDDRDQIIRLLDHLPPQQRTVVVLRYYADMSEQAVADQLGISVGAVKSAASRGLAALRPWPRPRPLGCRARCDVHIHLPHLP